MKNLFIILIALISISATPMTELAVKGSCSHCKQRIEMVANKQKGVSAAKWNGKTEMLSVKINPEKSSVEELSKALAKAGHDTKLDLASDSIYYSLPKCCRYRD
ncbi:MAG: heavy-metal-associated domain-containing protein [Bacteroidales bacterium]